MTTATATQLRKFLTACPDPVVGEFLAGLFASAVGVIELRAFPSKARVFASLSDLDTLLGFLAEHGSTEDLYYGVAARRDATSGALVNCTTLGAIFTDIDFKVIAEPEARRRVAEFPLLPSLVVHSGHGLHVYYLLREPFDLAADEARARGLLIGLAAALGGDRSAAEPARILRLPGTWNRKGEPVPVTLEVCEPTRRYNASELEEWLPEEPTTNGAGRFHVAAEPVGVGDRHRTGTGRLSYYEGGGRAALAGELTTAAGTTYPARLERQ